MVHYSTAVPASSSPTQHQLAEYRTLLSHPHQSLTLTCYIRPRLLGKVIGRKGSNVLTLQREATRLNHGHKSAVRISVLGSSGGAGGRGVGGRGGDAHHVWTNENESANHHHQHPSSHIDATPHHALLEHATASSNWSPILVRSEPCGAFSAARLLRIEAATKTTNRQKANDRFDANIVVDVPIHRSRHSMLIGRKGMTVKELSSEFGVRIMIPGREGNRLVEDGMNFGIEARTEREREKEKIWMEKEQKEKQQKGSGEVKQQPKQQRETKVTEDGDGGSGGLLFPPSMAWESSSSSSSSSSEEEEEKEDGSLAAASANDHDGASEDDDESFNTACEGGDGAKEDQDQQQEDEKGDKEPKLGDQAGVGEAQVISTNGGGGGNNKNVRSGGGNSGGANPPLPSSFYPHRPMNPNIIQLEGDLDRVEACLVKILSIVAGSGHGLGHGHGQPSLAAARAASEAQQVQAQATATRSRSTNPPTPPSNSKSKGKNSGSKGKESANTNAGGNGGPSSKTVASPITAAAAATAPTISSPSSKNPTAGDPAASGPAVAPSSPTKPKYSQAIVKANPDSAHLMPSLTKLRDLGKWAGAIIRRTKVPLDSVEAHAASAAAAVASDDAANTDLDVADEEGDTHDVGGADNEEEDDDADADAEAAAVSDGNKGKVAMEQQLVITGKTDSVEKAVGRLVEIFGEDGCICTIEESKTRPGGGRKKGGRGGKGSRKPRGGRGGGGGGGGDKAAAPS